jgi:hypothetical protein
LQGYAADACCGGSSLGTSFAFLACFRATFLATSQRPQITGCSVPGAGQLGSAGGRERRFARVDIDEEQLDLFERFLDAAELDVEFGPAGAQGGDLGQARSARAAHRARPGDDVAAGTPRGQARTRRPGCSCGPPASG